MKQQKCGCSATTVLLGLLACGLLGFSVLVFVNTVFVQRNEGMSIMSWFWYVVAFLLMHFGKCLKSKANNSCSMHGS